MAQVSTRHADAIGHGEGAEALEIGYRRSALCLRDARPLELTVLVCRDPGAEGSCSTLLFQWAVGPEAAPRLCLVAELAQLELHEWELIFCQATGPDPDGELGDMTPPPPLDDSQLRTTLDEAIAVASDLVGAGDEVMLRVGVIDAMLARDVDPATIVAAAKKRLRLGLQRLGYWVETGPNPWEAFLCRDVRVPPSEAPARCH